MSTEALVAFLAAALLIVVTPGLDTMLVLRNVVTGGRRGGLATAVGIALGCALWGAASLAGITALLRASQFGYDLLRLAGAGYLIWLGGSALWRSWRPGAAAAVQPDEAAEPARPRTMAALRAGLVTNLLNPKVGVFYLSLLPQFLPAGSGAGGWGAALVLIHIGLGLLWLSTVVWLAGAARAVLARQAVRRWLDRITATVLVGLGLKLAFQGP